MSFILDALRKSEHERQRNTGPGLAEVPVVAPRPRTNVWAAAAVALLVVNLVAVGVLMLRRAQKDDSAATATGAPSASAPAEVASASPPAGTAVNPTLAPVTQGPVTQAPAPAATPPPAAARPAPVDAGRNPLASEVSGGSPGLDSEMAERAAAVPAGPPAVTRKDAVRRGSVVYATVPEAADAPYSPPAVAQAPAPAPAAEAMPTADEVTARGGLPELHLDLHVYATSPQQRFIFVNSRKYREGETLQEGPVIEQITPDGAVLNYRGSRFKLSND